MFKAKQKRKSRPPHKAPIYHLVVGTDSHNGVSIATGRYEQINQKCKRLRRADRRAKLFIAMVRAKAGPGVPVVAM